MSRTPRPAALGTATRGSTVLRPHPSPTSVMVASPRPLARYGLRYLLGDRADIRLLAEVTALREAARLLVHSAPHILLVDSSETDRNVLELTAVQEIRSRRPHCRIVVLAEAERIPRLRALDLETISFLPCGQIGFDLPKRLCEIRAGAAVTHRPARGRPPRTPYTSATPPRPSPRLTHREEEVLDLLARGLSNLEISQGLNVSAATVKFHVGSLIRKFGVRRRTEVVYLAGRWGLT
jgi:DNA-binding NarL/FixJ family response regulator